MLATSLTSLAVRVAPQVVAVEQRHQTGGECTTVSVVLAADPIGWVAGSPSPQETHTHTTPELLCRFAELPVKAQLLKSDGKGQTTQASTADDHIIDMVWGDGHAGATAVARLE